MKSVKSVSCPVVFRFVQISCAARLEADRALDGELRAPVARVAEHCMQGDQKLRKTWEDGEGYSRTRL